MQLLTAPEAHALAQGCPLGSRVEPSPLERHKRGCGGAPVAAQGGRSWPDLSAVWPPRRLQARRGQSALGDGEYAEAPRLPPQADGEEPQPRQAGGERGRRAHSHAGQPARQRPAEHHARGGRPKPEQAASELAKRLTRDCGLWAGPAGWAHVGGAVQVQTLGHVFSLYITGMRAPPDARANKSRTALRLYDSRLEKREYCTVCVVRLYDSRLTRVLYRV